ncbi:MAG: tetratricopeptide repeat protein [Polyangia bacterium]
MGCALAVVLVSGCLMTTDQGDKIRDDISRLSKRMEAIETSTNDQMARLRKLLDEATGLLERNSADLGTKVARNESDIAALTGKLEEAKHILDELQRQLTTRLAELEESQQKTNQAQQKIIDRVAPSMPEDKEALWKEAQNRLAGGMREDARRFLRSFIQRFPSDPRASQAQLQIGQSLVQEFKYGLAVAEYLSVMSRFSRSAEVPEAMWLLGESYVAMKYCTDAKAIFLDLSKRYPKSPRAGQVKERLRDIQKIARNKDLCTS